MKIYLDMDGVLTDFERRYTEKFGHFPKDSELRRKHFWENWKQFVDDKEFVNLSKHPGAEKLLHHVQKLNDDGIEVEILSSSGGGYSHDMVIEQKKKWLNNNHIHYKANIVPGGGHKAAYAKKWHILVDDTENVVERYRAAGGTAILHKDVDKTIDKLYDLYSEWKSKVKQKDIK